MEIPLMFEFPIWYLNFFLKEVKGNVERIKKEKSKDAREERRK